MKLSDADVSLVGPASSAAAVVAGAGDLDGDGFDDILIGAMGLDWIAEDRGGVFVMFGR